MKNVRDALKIVLLPVGVVLTAGENVKNGAVAVKNSAGERITAAGDVHRGRAAMREGVRDMCRQAGAQLRQSKDGE